MPSGRQTGMPRTVTSLKQHKLSSQHGLDGQSSALCVTRHPALAHPLVAICRWTLQESSPTA